MLLDFNDSRQILDSYQLPLVDSRVISTDQELDQAVEELGLPVVMKIDAQDPDTAHKTDLGGVKVGLTDQEQARQALNELQALGDHQVVIQKQIAGEEMIVGGRQDEVFGPIVMVGLGGVLVEIYQDIVFRLAPIDQSEAHRMIDEIRGRKILEGYRGRQTVNKDQLAEIITQTSKLLSDNQHIKELDLNPVMGFDELFICDVKIFVCDHS